MTIFDYEDYRDFLKSWFDHKKSKSDYWSYGLWAKKLEIKSSSTLTMIIKKDRHAGPKLVDKLIKYFEFNREEEKYFRELVRLNKMSKDDPKLLVMLRSETSLQQKEKTDLIFQWPSYALREMSHLRDFKPNSSYLQKRLRTSLDKKYLGETLKKLRDKELLNKDFKVTNKIMSPEGPINQVEVKKYHNDLMELAKKALEVETQKRIFTSSTISISKKKINKAQKLIRDFQVEFGKLIETTPGDEVYLFNMQFFPLTEEIKDKD